MDETEKESDMMNIMIKLEKVSAEAGLLRELFAQKDERLSQMMSESGEMRVLFANAEKENQANSMKIEKLNSILKTVDPIEIEKTLAMKEKMIVEAQAKVGRMEMMLEDLRTNYLDISAKLEKLGNFESISKVYKEVDGALSVIKRKENNIKLLTGKVETTFFEMEKRIKEFDKTMPLIERTEDLSNEMLKNLGDIDIKMSNFTTREELEESKKDVRKEVKKIVNAVEDQYSKKYMTIQQSENFKREISGKLSTVEINRGDIVEIVAKEAMIFSDFTEFKNSLAEVKSQLGQTSLDFQKLIKSQDMIKKDFENGPSQNLEEKLINISSSVDTLIENNLKLSKTFSNVSTSVTMLEGERKKFDEAKIEKEFEDLKKKQKQFEEHINEEFVELKKSIIQFLAREKVKGHI